MITFIIRVIIIVMIVSTNGIVVEVVKYCLSKLLLLYTLRENSEQNSTEFQI